MAATLSPMPSSKRTSVMSPFRATIREVSEISVVTPSAPVNVHDAAGASVVSGAAVVSGATVVVGAAAVVAGAAEVVASGTVVVVPPPEHAVATRASAGRRINRLMVVGPSVARDE